MTFQIQIRDQQLISCWAEATKAVFFLPCLCPAVPVPLVLARLIVRRVAVVH